MSLLNLIIDIMWDFVDLLFSEQEQKLLDANELELVER
jgi:hypothetical protein